MATETKPRKVRPKKGAYYTDEKRLVEVIGFEGDSVIVEDCKTGQEMIVTPKRFPRWRPVKRERIA